MKFGITTSATQIEGGNNKNSWWEWANMGKVKDDTDPYVACEHYRRVEEDAALLSDLGVKFYRMSVEWARIEPYEGVFDQKALQHYVDEIRLLKGRGIEVTVTLHHFTNPSWFERAGAFETAGCWDTFARYAAAVARALKSDVTDYITFNEPNTYAMAGYVYGIFPPGVKKVGRAKRVMSNLCACHIRAYEAIHAVYETETPASDASADCSSETVESDANRKKPRVGAALQFKILQPKYKTSLSDAISNNQVNKLYQRSLSHGMFKGLFLSPLRKPRGIKLSRGVYYDFVGINYFTRTLVKMGGHGVKEDVPVSDTGIEIYPEGLGKVIRAVHAHFDEAPVIVVANGVADRRDAFRCRFIYEHLKAIEMSGVPVEGYYYYTLMDCFEWLDGIAPKYGLYETDFGAQERKLRRSGAFYRAVIAAGGVTDALYREYVEGQQYENN